MANGHNSLSRSHNRRIKAGKGGEFIVTPKSDQPVKTFPAGSSLDEVEEYLKGEGRPAPRFVVSKPDDIAKRFIRDVSRRSVDYFAPYKIDDMPFEPEWLTTTAASAPVIDRWGKPSIFWCDLAQEDRFYNFVLMVAKYSDMNGNYPNTQTTPNGWVTRSQIRRVFAADDTAIDLTEPPMSKEKRQELIVIGLSVVVHVMLGIMDRPDEYVQSHGVRSRLDVARGKQSVITISLSQPRKIYERHPNAPPSGIHMPLHAVRGHWRRLKSGKMVWVSAHERGDPDVPRRSLTRAIP